LHCFLPAIWLSQDQTRPILQIQTCSEAIMSLLIKNVRHENRVVDILISGNTFERIGPNLDVQAETVIDGTDKAILPSFVNAHTHAAMTLLRGYADDMELHTWLTEYIWPLEGRLTEEDVTVGAELACLEMIKSGTTLFNDMYWHYHSTAQAAEKLGLRAAVSSVFIDFNDQETARTRWEECLRLYQETGRYSDRIQFALGPHAVYSVSRSSLEKVRDFALEHDLIIHMHVSETEKEVEECRQSTGLTPVGYLNQLGLLGPNLCACHCVWLTDEDIELLESNRVTLVHNPTSNMKLCSGQFPCHRLRGRDIAISLGTDGCSSNNTLDMLESMKFAALSSKAAFGDPTIMPAEEALAMATNGGSAIFGLNGGRIAEGKLADCILVDLAHPQLTPDYNLLSNLVYAANGDCVHTTICDGRILMHDRVVQGEADIVARARQAAARLTS
jgi:5-methylthioadenosine/S-adenosylhomocysteine deaminase